MSKLVHEFATLLRDMQDALVVNDVAKIDELTAKQQTCMGEIVRNAAASPGLKEELKHAMPEITRQLQLNEQLLAQALQINNTLMGAIYSNMAAARQAQAMPNPTSYRA